MSPLERRVGYPMARQDGEGARGHPGMEEREEVVVCMGPQLEMSRSVRGHKYHLLPALP